MDLDIDDDIPDVPDPHADFEAESTMPYCKLHFVRMESIKSRKTFTIYKCRVPGCKQHQSRARKKFILPAEPQWCPRCSDEPNNVFVACVVDEIRTFTIRFACPDPDCPFKIQLPRPDVEEVIRVHRRRKLRN